MAADSDTIEIDGELLIPVMDYVRFMLAREAANTGFSGADGYWREREREFYASYEQSLYNGRRVSLPNPRPVVPNA